MESLTKYELARIIGARSLQLSLGAPPLIKPKPEYSFVDIASIELEKDVIPLSVLR